MPRVSIIPGLRYDDAFAAIDWLCAAFGFERHLVVPDDAGGVAHAQLTLGDAMIMLGSTHESDYDSLLKQPREAGAVTQSPYVVIADVDAHYERARNAGAEIVMALEEQHYGGKLYSARDPEGHLWNFGSYDPWAEQPTPT